MIEIKSVEELRIDKEKTCIQIVVDNKGNKYLPYHETLKILFKNKSLVIAKELKPILSEHYITIKAKIYIPVYDFRYILKLIDDDTMRLDIMCQVFRVSRPKLDIIEKVEIGVKALSGISGICGELFSEIHEFDCRQGDILHDIENEDDDKVIVELSKELRQLRKDRRTAKDRYKLLNYVKTFLDNEKIQPSQLGNLNLRFSEIKQQINSEHVIYFNRSAKADNKKEMEASILALSNHFKGVS